MYHKTAQQLSRELIVIPDPRMDHAAEAAKLVVLEFGPIEIIDNFVKAHIAVGKIIETIPPNIIVGIPKIAKSEKIKLIESVTREK